MKKYFILFILFTSQTFASEVSLNFKNIPLTTFSEATLGKILNKDYVISNELLTRNNEVTVYVKKIDTSKLPSLIENVLLQHGIQTIEKNNITYLSASNSNDNVFQANQNFKQESPIQSQSQSIKLKSVFFQPTNRKPSFIADVLNSAFPLSKPSIVLAGSGIVINSEEEVLDQILNIAKSIDLASTSLKISATFVEVSNSNNDSQGVSILANFLGSQFNFNLGTTNNLMRFKTKNFDLILDALSTDSRFKQISSPSGVVSDSEKIVLNFGDSVPTVSGSQLDKNGNPLQQIQYQQSGVILDVTPNLLNSGRIDLKVDGQVSSFVQTKTGVSTSPTLVKRQVQTTLTLDDGEVLLIGGLSNSRSSTTSSGVSFLPKFLDLNSNDQSKSDLVLLISASVIK